MVNISPKMRLGLWMALYAGFFALWLSVLAFLWSEPAPNDAVNLTIRAGQLMSAIFLLQLTHSFLQSKIQTGPFWILAALSLPAYLGLNSSFFPSSPANMIFRQIIAGIVLLGAWFLIMGTSIFLTIYAYHTADQPRASLRALVWGLALALVMAGNNGLFAGKSAFGFLFTFLGVLAVFIDAAFLLAPFSHYDSRRIQREYSLSVSSVLNLDLLATTLVGLVNEAMEITSGYLFLVDGEIGPDGKNIYNIHGARGMGEGKPANGRLSADNPVTVFFLDRHLPLLRTDLDRLAGMEKISAKERQWLSSVPVEVYIPIFTKNEWIGILILGPKTTNMPYSTEDMDLLWIMAGQTAVALKNIQLMESLNRINNDFRRAYAALERANHEMERLDRTKSDFISIASHELRTPISVIRGYTEILMDEETIKENSYYNKMVTGIHAGIIRLHEIVDSMLDMASIDTRSLQLEAEPVHIHMILRLLGENLSQTFIDRRLNYKLDDNLRDLPPIEGDGEALRKVFNHLLLNSIKFTPDGGEISVAGRILPASSAEPTKDSHSIDLPEGGVEIVISDTGVGIEDELQELIFTKFYQTGKLELHSTGKTKFKGGGQGLGLSIAKGIIEAHGGRIWAESPGYDEKTCPGSNFYVVLPLKREFKPAAP